MPFIVYLTCFSQVLSMAGFAAWPIYLIDLQNLWSLTNLEAGWISGAFFFGYIFATPFLVGLTDSYDSKKVYLISSLIGSIGLILFALFANGFYSALLMWSIVGAGFAGTYMPGLQILNERLDAKGKEKYKYCFRRIASKRLFNSACLESTSYFKNVQKKSKISL